MIVLDASCLYELLINGRRADSVRRRLAAEPDMAAPCCIDAELAGVVRRDWLRGALDETTAALAMRDLGTWPGYRVPHVELLPRAWELRGPLRTWEALYVSLAERLDCPLVTLDRRMAGVQQIRCAVEVFG